MALIDRIRYRADDWRWRVRYWWLDTERGARARVIVFVLACLVVIMQTVRLAVHAAMPAPVVAQHAIYWWVVQLIIAVISAAISYALRPKPPEQAAQKFDGPTVDDGAVIDDHFGEVWIDKPHMLAWKKVGEQKIKSKGGKK